MLRARNDPFPREVLLFYEGVKEARALSSRHGPSNADCGCFEETVYSRYTKPPEYLFPIAPRLETGGQSALCSRPLCQLVTWAPCRREKNELRGAPFGIDRDRVPFFLTPGIPILRRATFRPLDV